MPIPSEQMKVVSRYAKWCENFNYCQLMPLYFDTTQNVKVTSFDRVALSYPLRFDFPLSLGYIRKLAFRFPWENYFTTGFVCSQQTAPGNVKLAQTQDSQGTNSHLGEVK